LNADESVINRLAADFQDCTGLSGEDIGHPIARICIPAGQGQIEANRHLEPDSRRKGIVVFTRDRWLAPVKLEVLGGHAQIEMCEDRVAPQDRDRRFCEIERWKANPLASDVNLDLTEIDRSSHS
jgi:hypothetical protein